MSDVAISWDLYIYAYIIHLQSHYFIKLHWNALILKEKHTNGQHVYEKMLNITSHLGKNANQNHNEISLHTCQDGYYSKQKQK